MSRIRSVRVSILYERKRMKKGTGKRRKEKIASIRLDGLKCLKIAFFWDINFGYNIRNTIQVKIDGSSQKELSSRPSASGPVFIKG